MLLGSIIANLSDETSILETLASLDDLVLMARMREAAAEAGEPLGCFASAAVGSFVARADDAAWLSLMAVTSKADDPGRACLRYILGTEIPASKPSCSCQPGALMSTGRSLVPVRTRRFATLRTIPARCDPPHRPERRVRSSRSPRGHGPSAW